jgi:D-glycerate 3-kinase
LNPALADYLTAERLPDDYREVVERVLTPLAARIVGAPRGADFQVIGITGSQGSGKTAAAGALAILLREAGLKTAVLSIDDLYLTHAEREALAARVHPLFATRGVPGTHDVGLGQKVIESLGQPGETAVPRFDKARDDRRPPEQWGRVEGPLDVVLFEGWCVGAKAQRHAALVRPINDLERDEDPLGVWRRYANDQLEGPYRPLFDRIGLQVLLRDPGFETVLGWRQQQEAKLREREGGGQSDAELARFVQFYERLTRHIDAEMPMRADVVVQFGPDREIRSIRGL